MLHFYFLKDNCFSARHPFKTLHTVTESLLSVVSIEIENCQWLVENLKLGTRFSVKWK